MSSQEVIFDVKVPPGIEPGMTFQVNVQGNTVALKATVPAGSTMRAKVNIVVPVGRIVPKPAPSISNWFGMAPPARSAHAPAANNLYGLYPVGNHSAQYHPARYQHSNAIPQPAQPPAAASSSKNSRGQRPPPVPQQPIAMITINGNEVNIASVAGLERSPFVQDQRRRWWHDARSGAWGVEGGPCLGVYHSPLGVGRPIPGAGPLSPAASGGASPYFINGRALHAVDVAALMAMGVTPVAGRWWLDATGSYGVEGSAIPLGNLMMNMLAGRSGGGGGTEQRRSVLSTYDRCGATVL